MQYFRNIDRRLCKRCGTVRSRTVMTKLPITITLTGPVTFRDGSGTEIRGLSRRAQAMLAFLSLQPGQKAERGLLADLLWSDRPEE